MSKGTFDAQRLQYVEIGFARDDPSQAVLHVVAAGSDHWFGLSRELLAKLGEHFSANAKAPTMAQGGGVH